MEPIYNLLASMVGADPTLEKLKFADAGIVYAYNELKTKVLANYKNSTDPFIQNAVKVINAFIAELNDDKTILAQNEVVVNTIQRIEDDVISFINSYVAKETGISGGDDENKGVDVEQGAPHILSRHPSLDAKTANMAKMENLTKSMEFVTPQTPVTPVEQVRFDPSMSNTEESPVEKIGENKYKLKPSKNALKNEQENIKVLKELLFVNGKLKEDLASKMHVGGIYYINNYVKKFESIRAGNAILKAKVIRPPILITLVKELAAAYNTPEQFNKCMFSIIQWYLLQNNTKGIDLPTYAPMVKAVKTTDDRYKKFIKEINKHIGYL